MTKNQLPSGVLQVYVFGFGLGFQIQIQDWGNKGHIGEYGWSGKLALILDFQRMNSSLL